MNNSAKPLLPYSVLNPETNSDSPSAKSKGARLHSAIILKYQIKIKGVISASKFADTIFKQKYRCKKLNIYK